VDLRQGVRHELEPQLGLAVLEGALPVKASQSERLVRRQAARMLLVPPSFAGRVFGSCDA
jgi:hypothetical protein